MSVKTPVGSALDSGTNRPCSSGRSSTLESDNLVSVVRAYRANCRNQALSELRTFAEEPTLAGAVRRAGLAETPDGKRYHHQRRLSRWTLETAAGRLRRAPLHGCKSFHELHRTIGRSIGSIPGVGELMVYDTALRIGARLGLEPDHVYLHAGTRAGARRLGLDWRAPHIERRRLPRELRRLPAREVEDILCIYKDRLGQQR